jgi:tetratricopeptide (TPR) repeat protein
MTVLVVRHRVGTASQLRGALQESSAILEPGLRLAQRTEIPSLYPLLASSLAYVYALLGRCAEALPLAEEAMAQSPSSQRAGYLAEVYLLSGQRADAVRIGQQALDLSRHYHERGEEARALRLLGEIAAHADPPEVQEAERYYRQALALAAELGMRPLVAHCHLGLGTLHQRVGRHDEAQAELANAAEMYRAMEMTFWLARVEAALAA